MSPVAALLFLFGSVPAMAESPPEDTLEDRLLMMRPFIVMEESVSNLDVTCIKCICHASTRCQEDYDCSPEQFCGPLFISRKYWEDAGSIALNQNRIPPDGGFEECVKNFHCASKVLTNYMANTGYDCNGDGVTDCDDYARIHYLGPHRCDRSIENSLYYRRYLTCRPPKSEDDFAVRKK